VVLDSIHDLARSSDGIPKMVYGCVRIAQSLLTTMNELILQNCFETGSVKQKRKLFLRWDGLHRFFQDKIWLRRSLNFYSYQLSRSDRGFDQAEEISWIRLIQLTLHNT
jgi:hypothetical protein